MPDSLSFSLGIQDRNCILSNPLSPCHQVQFRSCWLKCQMCCSSVTISWSLENCRKQVLRISKMILPALLPYRKLKSKILFALGDTLTPQTVPTVIAEKPLNSFLHCKREHRVWVHFLPTLSALLGRPFVPSIHSVFFYMWPNTDDTSQHILIWLRLFYRTSGFLETKLLFMMAKF